MTETLAYFAYGSNMFTPRLRYRITNCVPVAVAKLPGYQLRFHKRGKDLSAKCDAFATGRASDRIIGVLYEISPSSKAALDRYEGVGRGYAAASVEVVMDHGDLIGAETYLATSDAIDPSLKPFGWYKEFVLAGAREHGLPETYIDAFIRAVAAEPDPDPERERDRRAEVSFDTPR